MAALSELFRQRSDDRLFINMLRVIDGSPTKWRCREPGAGR